MLTSRMFTKAIIVNIEFSAASAVLLGKFLLWKGFFLFVIIPVPTANRNYNLSTAAYFGVSTEARYLLR